MTVIDVRGLVKKFGSFTALDHLDLTVSAGEVRGFLGPNGAGKSTAIRVLLGLLRADDGEIRMFDGDPWRDAVALHRRLAYVPGDVTLWPNLTGGECIDYLARLRGGVDAARRAELLERFELDPTKKGRTYSKGNRQKVALVAALASNADLFIFDEPTSGLDPLMETVFTDYVNQLRAQGTAILLSSHILSEVEKVCDTVTIIRAGRAVESGTLAELRHLTRSRVQAVVTAPDVDALGRIVGVHDLSVQPVESGLRVTFNVDDSTVAQILAPLSGHGVQSLQVTPPSLEDLFLRHYGDAPAADAS
ncbi:ABC transporter ATP-binding protein [Gordonia sp. (in: high G+C Gram-positive bacteria)]|uniref:ABC transporter ATP-binding protein n=1 Tax=Gordonia sp. (in: high G+C Gram-positive bacteria) TaxID=84139 RepID=UPI00168FA62F|nr:ABC transporter ATP-binding protein [Gordonia sp. (in: high G+C Gram-positive bacteria)]NLG45295.1 ABC transporter ATP-binding protein [Gordonia sp. (in: high G+C Gram-positive bacteria)]